LVQQVTIERMRPGDVPRVMEIEVQCFPTPWHESAYLTELSNRSAYYIVAKAHDVVVGYAGLWIIMDESHITTIGVDPDYRGLKIGEQLLLAMIDEAMSRGAHRVTLEVRERNMVAQNLYRKYGFSPAAIRRGYYTDNNENALVMWISNMHDPDYIDRLRKLKEQLFGAAEGVGGVERVE
jgi:ribosomal-protein-alanine N-acetyltransferase